MHPVVIHVLLLFIDLIYDSQSRGLFRSQLTFLFQEFIEIFPISFDVLELLFDRFADLLRCALFALCQIQIIFSGFFAIHAGFVIVKSVTDVIYDRFQIFSGFV